MKRIIVAPDKFKGTLTAAEAADIICGALSITGCHAEAFPMADGGEGTAECVGRLRGMLPVKFAALNSMGEPIPGGVKVWYNAVSGDVAVDTSTVLSLQLLGGEPRIMDASSWSFGRLLRDIVLKLHPSTLYIGVGGTSTGDGGAGMFQSLGARLIDRDGMEIKERMTPRMLSRIVAIDRGMMISLPPTVVLSDVDVPLVDEADRPSSLSFARQKGASEADIVTLGDGLRHWARVADIGNCRFAGAGGGLGAALMSLPDSRGELGAEWILRESRLWDNAPGLIITGEGSVDGQTAMGKIAGILAAEGRRRGIPVIAVGGRVGADAPSNLFTAVYSTTDYPGATPAERLRRAVEAIVRDGRVAE